MTSDDLPPGSADARRDDDRRWLSQLRTPVERPRPGAAPALDGGAAVPHLALVAPVGNTEPTRSLQGCACGRTLDEVVAGQYCLCGRNAMLTGAWAEVVLGEQRHRRFLRKLDTAVRILRVLGAGDTLLAHVLPVHAGDIGSVTHRWTLHLAVPARVSTADVWWRGYPFALIRRVPQAPWLSRAESRSGLRLTDGRTTLEIIDAFLHASGGPLEILVGPYG
jgi:hypothetical protein